MDYNEEYYPDEDMDIPLENKHAAVGPLPPPSTTPRIMKTDQHNIEVAQSLKATHLLRSRMEKIRRSLQSHMANINTEIEQISQALEVEYTPYCAILKKKPEGGWECIAIVDNRDLPYDMPEEWDLCMPIPKPETMPEFEGW